MPKSLILGHLEIDLTSGTVYKEKKIDFPGYITTLQLNTPVQTMEGSASTDIDNQVRWQVYITKQDGTKVSVVDNMESATIMMLGNIALNNLMIPVSIGDTITSGLTNGEAFETWAYATIVINSADIYRQ